MPGTQLVVSNRNPRAFFLIKLSEEQTHGHPTIQMESLGKSHLKQQEKSPLLVLGNFLI